MSGHTSSSEADDRIEQTAADWLVRRDRGFSAAEQDDFSQWLASDPRHGEAFARQQQTWREFNLLAEWRPEHSREPNPDLLARPTRVHRWLPRVAVPLAALFLILFTVHRGPVRETAPEQRAVLVVPVTRYERRVLEDGSVVQLNRGAAIDVRYSAGERRVELLSGEAHFAVQKDAARPFIVAAAGIGVRAVGTAFNVRLDADAIDVLVTEGTVAVQDATAAQAHEDARVESGHRAVRPITMDDAKWHITPVTADEIAHALAWQPVLLDFSATPLAEVVEAFNDRNTTQLVIADAELGALPIVASFRSDSIEAFVRLLEITAHVRAERRGEHEIILRKK